MSLHEAHEKLKIEHEIAIRCIKDTLSFIEGKDTNAIPDIKYRLEKTLELVGDN